MLHIICSTIMQIILNYCTECDKRYIINSVLKRPMAIHREEICISNCNECDYIFYNKRNAINLAIMHFLDKTFI